MKPTLTPAEQVVLGLVAEVPRHGYELEQLIELRGIRQWTELGFSSIYYILDKLEKRGYLASKIHDTKKVFSITASGGEALTAATTTSLVLPSPYRSSVLVGLMNSPSLAQADVIALLGKRKAALEKELRTLHATKAAQSPPAFVEAIFDYGLLQLAGEIAWCTETIKKLKEDEMEKIDFKKELAAYKGKHHRLDLVEVPPMQYLMIDGHGDPNTGQDFKDAILALYPVAYKLKFASKRELGKDYTVMPLEGLWWADDMSAFTSARDKSQWDFTLMIMQPDWITQEMFAAAVQKVAEKDPPVNLAKVRLETLNEGLCVQTLHVGAFDDEAEILDEMHNRFVPANGLKMTGKHHEIYFSDFRKVDPSKLRTMLRQPVQRV